MSSPYFGSPTSATSPYFGSGGTSGSPYFGGGVAKKHSSGGFGLDDLGIAGHLIGDVKDAIINLPAGVKVLATDPGKALGGIKDSYADTYGHGLGHFFHTFYEHPLGPILDLATVLTAGAGGIAKAGGTLAKAGVIAEDSALAKFGQAGTITLRSPAAKAGELGAPVAVKSTSRNPLIRVRQTLVDEALKQLDDTFPVFGENARFTRTQTRAAGGRALILKQEAVPYINAFAKLSRDERRALGVLGRLPLTTHLDAWKNILGQEALRGNEDAAQLLKDISAPKVQKLYETPTKAMLRAHAEAERLGDKAAEELQRLGVLTKTQAETAKYRHAILASGGTLPGRVATNRMLRSPAWQRASRRVTRLQKRYDSLAAKGQRGGFGEGSVFAVGPSGEASVIQGAKGSFRSSSPTLERVGTLLSDAKAELARVEARYGKKADTVEGPSVAELRDQIAAAGRPQPLYLPDVSARAERRGGGNNLGYTNPVNQSDGLLFMTGRLALDPDVLGPQFLRVSVYAHWRDLHDRLLDASVKIQPGGALPEGWMWVKRPPGVGDEVSLRGVVPNPDEVPDGLAARGFGTNDLGDALNDGKARYAVPEGMIRRFNAEFQKSNKAARWLLEKPTTVWRALVLNLRVAWLVNNVVGNHLLYALRYAGPNGLRGYLAAIQTSKGADAVRRLLSMPETQHAFTSADIKELLPQQHGGTFIGSQAPSIKGGRTLRKLGLGLAGADKAIEGGLRRGAVNAELRKAPEVKARLKAMPAETRSFRAAARDALQHDPQLADRVSDDVNKSLGDFLSLGPAERRYMRAIFPFYAWYKAITQITFKLPLDTPGRALLIEKLSEVGKKETGALGALPSFLEGAIPLGGDQLLKTQAVNPFATIPQLGRAGAVPFFPGQPTNQLAGTMNPFVQAIGGAVFGRDSTKRGLLADFASGIATDLPQVGLLTSAIGGPDASKLYQPSTTDDLLAYLGAGVKTINRKRAAELAAQGR